MMNEQGTLISALRTTNCKVCNAMPPGYAGIVPCSFFIPVIDLLSGRKNIGNLL